MSTISGPGGADGPFQVLYGDRDADFAAFLEDRLEREDERLRVTTASSVGEIRTATDEVDCVVLGSEIERTSPVSVLESIRDLAPDLPVVLFTSRGSESLASDAISAGVTDYVVREPGVEQYRILATRIANVAEGYRAEQRASEATERLSRIYERIDDAFYAVDDEWRVTYWNERMAERTGVPTEEIVGEDVWNYFPEMVDGEAYDRYHEAMATQEPAAFETYVESLDYWTEVRVFPDESGLSIYSREITDQKHREEALQRQTSHLRRFHEITTDEAAAFDHQLRQLLALGRDCLDFDVGMVADVDDEYTVRAVDAPELDLEQGTRFDLTGTVCAEMLDGGAAGVRTLTDVGTDAHPAYREYDVETFVGVPIRTDGGVYGGLSFAALEEPDGSVSEMDRTIVRLIAQWIGREIGHRRARREVETGERYLRSILDALPQQVFVKDGDGTYLLANEAAADVYSVTPEELEGSSDEEYGRESDIRDLRADDRDVIESGEPKTIPEDTFVDAAGNERVVRTEIRPLEVPGVDDRRALVITTDVTERKATERELQSTKDRLERLIEGSPSPIMAVDPDGCVTLWNGAAESLFGWDAAAVLGEYNPLVPDEKRDEHERLRSRVLDGEVISGRNVRRQGSDGERIDLSLSTAPISDESGDVSEIVAFLDDISERKRLEERLRSLHEADRELTIAETVEDIGAIAVEAADEMLDLPATCVWQYDAEATALVPIAVSETGQETVESVPTFEPGNSIAWNVFERGEPEVVDDTWANEETYNPESPLRSEIIVPLGDQGVMSAGSTETAAYDDLDAELFQILGGAVEASMIRAERERQLREREQELSRQNERLDEFTGVVAHDLRNPLSIAVGMLDVARQTGDDEHFQKADDALFRMDELIEDLLTLARHGGAVESTTTVSLARMANESWGYVETDDAELVVEADPEATVDADTDRLAQLLENLFRNAIEHGGRDVTVRVGALENGFYVEDTGDGIAADDREAVFDHGYTTDQDGTGFGLSIVADIARAHGWDPTVTEGAGGGARFEFSTGGGV